MRGPRNLIIQPGGDGGRYWRDLWAYRDLFAILAWRDIAVRYKQTAVGIAWVLLQPLAQVLVMVVVFGAIAGLPSEGGAPYALMVYAGMLPWQLFASAVSGASTSIAGNAGLISKVYFPRMIVPAAAVATALVDFLVSLLLLAALMLWFGHAPTWRLLALPAYTLLAIAVAFGPGLLIAALNAEYRDFRYVIPFIIQFGLYVSPVGFSSAVVRERFGEAAHLAYALNPMVGVIDGFRWSILGTGHPPGGAALAVSLLSAAAFLALGLRYFRGHERRFADVV